jgi:hypothetical protein
MKPSFIRFVAAFAVVAGVSLLVFEVRRAAAGIDYQVVFWGVIALGAIVFGIYELFFTRGETEEGERRG